jgi:hypothetical protein
VLEKLGMTLDPGTGREVRYCLGRAALAHETGHGESLEGRTANTVPSSTLCLRLSDASVPFVSTSQPQER